MTGPWTKIESPWLDEAMTRAVENRAVVAELFPQLPRRLGRHALEGGLCESHGLLCDVSGLRVCDAAAFRLLDAAEVKDEAILDLFHHGDMEERIMVMRVNALRAPCQTSSRLLVEALRSNTMMVFEAAVCDTNIVATARDQGFLSQEDLRRLLLKLAFNDLPLARVFGVERHAEAELTRMLQDFATEREAAGRPIWTDTLRLIARAPAPGTLARLLGGIEHGADMIRRAAAEGLAHLKSEAADAAIRERIVREPDPEIRQLLETALTTH